MKFFQAHYSQPAFYIYVHVHLHVPVRVMDRYSLPSVVVRMREVPHLSFVGNMK